MSIAMFMSMPHHHDHVHHHVYVEDPATPTKSNVHVYGAATLAAP